MLVSLLALLFFTPFTQSKAYNTGTTPTSIGSLTLNNYDTRTDGQVFDSTVLNTLYDKILGTSGTGTYSAVYNKVHNSTSVTTGNTSRFGTAEYENGGAVFTQQHSLDYSAIAGGTTASDGTKTAPNPIVLEFGGMKFNVVYMTTNTTKTTNGKPDLIMTLCASEESTTKYLWGWSGHNVGNTATAYPINLYSASYIRALAMNAGGDTGVAYATNSTTRTATVPEATRIASPYAQFTLTKAKIGQKSLTDYIVTPKYINLHYKESFNRIVCSTSTSAYNVIHDFPNESLNRTPTASDWDSYILANAFKPWYYEWEDDYIWLPSISEIGYTVGSAHNWANGLWGIPVGDPFIQQNSSAWSASAPTQVGGWSRSGDYSGEDSTTSWEGFFDTKAKQSHTVRPAFHLNLTQIASQFVDLPEIPAAPSGRTYNHAEQSFDLSGFADSAMSVPTIARTGGTAHSAATVTQDATNKNKLTIKFTDAGEYAISFGAPKSVNGSARFWSVRTFNADNSATAIKLKFTVKKAQLTVPSFGTGNSVTKTYDGTAQIFNASSFPHTGMTATPAYPRNPLTYVITRKVNGSVSPPAYAPVGAPQTNGTLNVTVRDAGDYEAKFTIADTANYEWADATQADKTVPFTVKKKALTLSSTTTVTGNVWGWAADKSESGTVTVSGFYNGNSAATPAVPADSVNLMLAVTDSSGASSYITGKNNNDGTYTFTVDKDISVFGGSYSVGTYYLKPVLGNGSAGTHDSNYELSTALSTIENGSGYKLVISAASAGLGSYDWQYTEDNGAAQAMPAGNKLKYKLNSSGSGTVYTVTVDTSAFPAHLSVDTSYTDAASGFVNGYKNNFAANANTYTTTVRLKASGGYQFANGTQTDDVTFSWEIQKADFDFTNVKWQYTCNGTTANYPAKWNAGSGSWDYLDPSGAVVPTDAGLGWCGVDYALSLANLPAGITVNAAGAYTGNRKKAIGSYTASCNVTYDTANFNAPPSAAVQLNWKIVKGKVEIITGSWTSSSQGSGSNIFYVPTLQNVSGIDYEYYDLGTDSAPIAFPGTKLNGISDITSTAGTTHHYYVKAVIKSGLSLDGVTAWADAIEIIDKTGGGTHNGQALGDCTKYFYTGDNRTPVQVTLNNAPYTYDKKPHAVLFDGTNGGELEITVGSNAFPASNFTVNYYLYDASNSTDHFKGTQLAGAPTDAGHYVLEIALTQTAGGSYYATDEYFDFEIKPFKFDMSQVQWGYLDENGNEVAYNPSSPPQYTLDQNGQRVEHELILIGLPKGDANGTDAEKLLAELFADSGLSGALLQYSGNTGSTVTVTGSLTARCEIDVPSLSENFGFSSPLPPSFSTGADGKATTTQSWKIEPKKINAPTNDSTHTFDGNVQDIVSYAGLDPAGLGVYYNITGLTKRDAQNNPQSLFTSANCANPNAPTADEVKAILATLTGAGRYGLTVQLIDPTNVKFVQNGAVGTLPTYSAQITVNKLKIQVVGWQGDGSAPWQASFASSDYPAGIVEDKFTDSNGNPVAAADLVNHYNEQFTQTIAPSAGNEDNVEVEFIAGADSQKQFLMLNQGNPPDPIIKPSVTLPSAGGTYTGGAQSFLPNGLQALVESGKVKLYAVDSDGNETEVGLDCFTQTNAGKYKIVAKINGNYYWDGTNYDKSNLEYEFEIAKAKVTPVWKEDSKGNPVANLPAGFEGIDSPFDYVYYDADGNEIPASELKGGSSYTVGVKLKDEFAGNFELTDSSGAAIEGGVALSDKPFTQPKSGFSAFVSDKFWFGLPMWVWLIIFAVLFILLIILLIVLIKGRKRRKEKREEKERRREEQQSERERQEQERQNREEERRRQQEERDEERRRKEEEREEERRRREEEREDERRRKEEEREEERRRREDERRAAMTAGGMNAGMQMPQMPQMPMPAQPYAQPMVQQPAPQPAPAPSADPLASVAAIAAAAKLFAGQAQETKAVPPADGERSSSLLREYEERLRSMERELQDRKMESILRAESDRARRELEDEARARRHEDEIRRLRELQEYERNFMPPLSSGYGAYAGYADPEGLRARTQASETDRLKLLEEELKRKEADNRLLLERLKSAYGAEFGKADRTEQPDPDQAKK